MANINHVDITDPNVHESVGASTALIGQTYVSDGLGSGSWTIANSQSLVLVSQASDLAGTLDSTKVYFVDGVVDMGSQAVTIPVGGLNLQGHNFNVSGLTSSAAGYKMFISPGGGSGDFLASDMHFKTSGAGSQLFDLLDSTGLHAIEMVRCNFNDCSSMGELDSYRQGFESGTGRFGGTPALTFSGTWLGGYFIDTSIVRSLDAGMTGALFKEGTSFVMNSRFRSNQNIDLPASASFFDFTASNFVNPSTLQMVSCIVSRDGVIDGEDANLTPNIVPTALVSSWINNNGLRNTFEGGEVVCTVEVTSTITTAGVFVDLLGTTVPPASSLSHFDSPANWQLRHLGTTPVEFKVDGQLVIDCAANDEVDVKVVIWDDSASAFIDGKTTRRVINSLQGGRNVAYFVIHDSIVLNKNDFIKLQVANVSATADITAELDSFMTVSRR